MKNKLKYLLGSLLLPFLFLSCEKDENKVTYEEGTAPALTANRTGTIPLSFANQANEAIKLNWTNPNYRFTTGINSQNVSYTLEIDTAGANFTNPKRQSIVISQELERSITDAQFNDYLLNQLQLDSLRTHRVQLRVTSTLGTNALPLHSNVLEYVVKPYAIPPKVVPPGTPPDYTNGKLYITGSATPASWMGGGDPELLSQKFTRINKTLYEITIQLSAGGSYLFVPVYGNWDVKYGFDGANNQNNVNGDNFKKDGGDMLSPATAGTYKIEADFQRGKFTVTKL